jgi:hypothetical protein
VLGQFAPEGASGTASAVYAKVLQADGRLAQVQCDHVAAQQRLRAALACSRRDYLAMERRDLVAMVVDGRLGRRGQCSDERRALA